jgi:hypothetical protein
MIRYAFHKLLGHHCHVSEIAAKKYHCFTCGKRWRRQS